MDADYGQWWTLAVFGAAAVLVCVAGIKLSGLVNEIAERTGMDKAFTGLLLLGGITSLPEVGVNCTAAVEGNADLSVANLMGGVAAQVAMLALVDAFGGKRALTAVVAIFGSILAGVYAIGLDVPDDLFERNGPQAAPGAAA